MQTMNSINILGHVGAAAEVHTFADGGKKTTLKIATNTGVGDKEKTQWHKVVFWGKFADAVAYMKAGDQICVRGCLDYNKWTDKFGQNRNDAEIKALEFSIIKSAGRQLEDNQSNQRNSHPHNTSHQRAAQQQQNNTQQLVPQQQRNAPARQQPHHAPAPAAQYSNDSTHWENMNNVHSVNENRMDIYDNDGWQDTAYLSNSNKNYQHPALEERPAPPQRTVTSNNQKISYSINQNYSHNR